VSKGGALRQARDRRPIDDTVSLPADSTLTYGINCFVTTARARPRTPAFVELGAGLDLVSATATQGFCLGTVQLTCPIGTLADGASASIRFVVTKTVGGPVASGISVLSSEFDPYQANNTNDEGTTPAALTGFAVE
jgi:hypothetical protein